MNTQVLDRLRHLDIPPELRLVAAIVVQSLLDAQQGDQAAYDWLTGPASLPWLAMLAPVDISPETLQARLVDMVDAPRIQASGISRLWEQLSFLEAA